MATRDGQDNGPETHAAASTGPTHSTEIFKADTIPWLDLFTPNLLEEDLGMEWDDASGHHASQTMLIVNQGIGGAGLVMSLLARRDFGVGRVVVAVPSHENDGLADEADAIARKMGATDVVVLPRNGNGKSVKDQLEEIGVREVMYTALCYSSYRYPGPYVNGESCELGASTGSCATLPGLDQLDEFLPRLTTVWNTIVADEIADERHRNEANAPESILVQLAKEYPDEEHWPRLIGCESTKLGLKSVILVQKSGVHHSRMQVAVGAKDG